MPQMGHVGARAPWWHPTTPVADPVSDLTALAYDAALDPAAWPPFLDRLAAAVGGIVPGLFWSRPAGGNELAIQRGVEPRWERAFHDYYVRLDIRRPLISALPEGSVFRGQDVLQDRDLVRAEFYNDFLRPQGLFHIAGAVVLKEGDAVGVIRVLRPRGARPFGARELDVFRRLAPHLKRALRIGTALHQAKAAEGAATAVLDRLPTAVFLLDAAGIVVGTNRSADDLLDRRDSLVLREGRLVSVVAGETERVARFVVEVARDNPAGVDRGIRMLRFATGAGGRERGTLVLAAIPLVANDPGQRVETPAGVLTRLFELTPAEARLAVALAEGKTLAEAAAKFGIKTSTARKQLNQILGKTRLHRQVDLVRALVGGPLGFRGPFATS